MNETLTGLEQQVLVYC